MAERRKNKKFDNKTASIDKATEGHKETKKLFLSKTGDANFHLWKEDMQLKIAIDFPLSPVFDKNNFFISLPSVVFSIAAVFVSNLLCFLLSNIIGSSLK